jgi:hypothetical protein
MRVSMLLIEELQRRIREEESLFRAQLLREDIARLTKLGELARSAGDVDTFKMAADGFAGCACAPGTQP